MDWLIGIAIGITVSVVLLMFRSEIVFNEKKRMLGLINLHVKELLINKSENSYQNYHDIYNDLSMISYDRMVWQFWKPTRSFYDGMIKKYDLNRFIK